ncbi:MAG: hypothetical protein Q8O67_13720 [Deltaproteobacteria bacterium]|nr:hypothetical protein [Deltaproteobacteria bacterium]
MPPPDRPRQLFDALHDLETARDEAREALVDEIIAELGVSHAETWVCIQTLSEEAWAAGLDADEELIIVCRLLEDVLALRAEEERFEARIQALGEMLAHEFAEPGQTVLVAAWEEEEEDAEAEQPAPPPAPLES